MFRSNNCIAVQLEDIAAAKNFYTNVMKFKLLTKSDESLEYDTGHFLLYGNRDLNTQPPIPSLTVNNIGEAKQSLLEKGRIILSAKIRIRCTSETRLASTYDVIKGK